MDTREDTTNASEDFAVQIAAIQPRLYGFILKRLANREQTLEVLQLTNLVLCRKSQEFQQGSSFAAWAFTVAKFQIMAWRRSQGSSRLIFSDQVLDLLDRDATTESDVVDHRIPLLKECLKHLRDQDRDLLQKRYRDGVGLAGIAKRLAKSTDAVGMRLHRIRRQLADCVVRRMNQEA